eukprot:5497596-Amphidinium_carterae.2
MIRRSVVSPKPKPPPPNLRGVAFKACPTPDPKPRSKRERQPPIKGSLEDIQRKLMRTPQTKPPPGFPPGTCVPLGFEVKTPGMLTFQPQFLPQGVMISQEQAAQTRRMAIARPAQPYMVSGCLSIVSVPPPMPSVPPPASASASYHQPSPPVSKPYCCICKAADSKSNPLKTCWYSEKGMPPILLLHSA